MVAFGCDVAPDLARNWGLWAPVSLLNGGGPWGHLSIASGSKRSGVASLPGRASPLGPAGPASPKLGFNHAKTLAWRLYSYRPFKTLSTGSFLSGSLPRSSWSWSWSSWSWSWSWSSWSWSRPQFRLRHLFADLRCFGVRGGLRSRLYGRYHFFGIWRSLFAM